MRKNRNDPFLRNLSESQEENILSADFQKRKKQFIQDKNVLKNHTAIKRSRALGFKSELSDMKAYVLLSQIWASLSIITLEVSTIFADLMIKFNTFMYFQGFFDIKQG